MTNPDINNFYFWLGADGTESLTADEFEQRQDEEREAIRKWEEVDNTSD